MANRILPRSRRSSAVAWSSLRELREARNLSQGELAHLIGTSQPAVLKTENAADPRLSTIRRHVEGLARAENAPSSVHIVATIGDNEVRLVLPDAAVDDERDLEDGGVAPATRPSATSPSRTAWRLRAWDDPDLEVAWHERRIISIGGDEIGDLTSWPTESELRSRLTACLPDRSAQAIGMFVTYWRYFVKEMAVGDLVAVPQSRSRVGIGRITGDYRYQSEEVDARLRHQRDVEWLRTIPRSELDEDIRKVVNAPGTICQIKAPGAAARLA